MSPSKIVPLLCAASLLAIVDTRAQVAPNTEFKIDKIVPTLVETPAGGGDKRVSRPKKWLEVEVEFQWQPRLKLPAYSGDLTFNYYILLNNSNAPAERIMLTKSVVHAGVPQEKGLHSVVYVSGRTLEKLFNGNVPVNVNGILVDVGVTITSGGQVVAESSFKGRGAWWATLTPTDGLALDKSETPFANMAWDYYEPVKPK